VNNCDALAPGIRGAEDRGVNAILQDPAAVRLIDPTQDLNECALAGPVLPGERMHPPGAKAEINVAQYLDGPEALGDPAKFNYGSL